MRLRALMVVAVVAVLGAPPAVASGHDGPDHDEPETAQGESQPRYAEYIDEDYRVETEHGTIFGWVRRPVVPPGVEVPVILTYSPYNATRRPHNAGTYTDDIGDYFVPRGYARAFFDLVGTRESGGCYDFGGVAERDTGVAVVEFLADQSWSNGRVGMIGGSYDGTTQYATAIEAPAGLATIVPQVAIDRWYDYPYEHGVRRTSGFGTPLLFDFGFGFLPPTDPSDPTAFAEAAADRVNPCERAQNQIEGYGHDPLYDDFWVERDYREHAGDVEASVLIEGGWLDTNVQPVGSTAFFRALPEDHPKKLVMGQWGHSTASFRDSMDLRHAWFDHWLLGLDTGVMDLPRVDSELSTGERLQFEQWPPETTRETRMPLVAGDPGDAELGLTSPSATWIDESRGPFSIFGQNGDYTCTQQCSVRFDGAPLDGPVRISGTAVLELDVTTEALLAAAPEGLSTQFIVEVSEVTSNGQERGITRGMLNGLNRDGLDSHAPVEPGEPYRVAVELDVIDHRVGEGSRLSVRIGGNEVFRNAFLPNDDPPTVNTVLLDGQGSSGLRLPVSDGHTVVGIDPPQATDGGG